MTTVNTFSFTPAESWALIGALAVLALLFTLLLKELLNAADVFPKIVKKNINLCGLKGLWYALWGVELAYIGLEKCIETVPKEGGAYKVTTTDGNQNKEYTIVYTRKLDENDPDYQFAKKYSFGDEKLLQNLLPDSKVLSHYCTTSNETGEVLDEIFVLYLKYDRIVGVEEALNKYFERE